MKKKAEELGITVGHLIWNYVNRGLMGDGCNEDTFRRFHSEKFLKEVNEALDVD